MPDYDQLAYNLRKPLGVYLAPFTEENIGTFTPTFQGSGTPGTWTYSIQAGFWTRIGNRVLFSLSVNAAKRPVAPTGTARIAGLPFTSNATANSHSVVDLSYDALTLSATIVQLIGQIPTSAAYIEFLEPLGTAPVATNVLAATGLSATAFIRASGQYMV
jgi:hypothetical protein